MYLYSVYIIQSTDIYPSLDTSLPQSITTPSFRIRIYANGPFWKDSLTVNSFPDFLHYLLLFVYKTSINSFSRGSSPCQSCFPETTLTRFSPSCGSSCHTDYSLRTFFIFFNPDFSSPLVQYIPEQSELFLPPPLVTSETLCLHCSGDWVYDTSLAYYSFVYDLVFMVFISQHKQVLCRLPVKFFSIVTFSSLI